MLQPGKAESFCHTHWGLHIMMSFKHLTSTKQCPVLQWSHLKGEVVNGMSAIIVHLRKQQMADS